MKMNEKKNAREKNMRVEFWLRIYNLEVDSIWARKLKKTQQINGFANFDPNCTENLIVVAFHASDENNDNVTHTRAFTKLTH